MLMIWPLFIIRKMLLIPSQVSGQTLKEINDVVSFLFFFLTQALKRRRFGKIITAEIGSLCLRLTIPFSFYFSVSYRRNFRSNRKCRNSSFNDNADTHSCSNFSFCLLVVPMAGYLWWNHVWWWLRGWWLWNEGEGKHRNRRRKGLWGEGKEKENWGCCETKRKQRERVIWGCCWFCLNQAETSISTMNVKC